MAVGLQVPATILQRGSGTSLPGRTYWVLTGGSNWVMSVDWSRDGQRVLTASFDGTARVWDAVRGAEKLMLVGHGSLVMSAVFSPDDKTIATAGADNTVRLWSLEPKPEHRLLRADTTSWTAYPSFTPDGRWTLVENGIGVDQLWDLAEGKLIRSWRGRSGMIRPDGREIATALEDGTIEIREASPVKFSAVSPRIPAAATPCSTAPMVGGL